MTKQVLALAICFASLLVPQTTMTTPRKVPGADKPKCAAGAICFSGEVSAGHEFRNAINADMDLILQPGWTIAVVPTHPKGECNEFASVVNAPYRAHRSLYIDTSYGWTAEDEVGDSPREFNFVTNCADYQAESARLNTVLWGYEATQKEYNDALAKLATSPLGKGRLWITDSKVSHATDTADNKLGRIEWIIFSVEILLPKMPASATSPRK